MESNAQQPSDDSWRSETLQIDKLFRRGIITAEEACQKILFFISGMPSPATACLSLLPDEVQAAFPAVLATLPVSDEGWVTFREVGQFDGDEWTRVRTVVRCRTNTEAVRACLLGEFIVPPASDFVDRILADYRARR